MKGSTTDDDSEKLTALKQEIEDGNFSVNLRNILGSLTPQGFQVQSPGTSFQTHL